MEYERSNSIGAVGKGKLKKFGKDLTSSELFSVPDGKVKPFIEIQCCSHGKQKGNGKEMYARNCSTMYLKYAVVSQTEESNNRHRLYI